MERDNKHNQTIKDIDYLKDNIEIIIDGKTGYEEKLLINNNFNCKESINDYQSKMSFLIEEDDYNYSSEDDVTLPFNVYSNVEVYLYGKLLTAGEINSIKYEEYSLFENKLIVSVDISSFNDIPTRRTIYGIYNPDKHKYAGDMVKHLIDRYLFEDGVKAGKIEKGGELYKINEDFFDTESAGQILDNLAGIDNSSWYIDKYKRLHFYREEEKGIKHTADEYIVKKGSAFKILDISIDNASYFNKVFIRGGEPHEEYLQEEDINYDGTIKYVLENTEEINRIKKLNGGTGVYGVIIDNDKIHTLKEAHKLAFNNLIENSSIPVNMTVETNYNHFNVNDYLEVNLKHLGIVSNSFKIIEKEVKTYDYYISYVYKLTNNLEMSQDKRELEDVLKEVINRKYKPKALTGEGEEGEGGDGGEDIEIPTINGTDLDKKDSLRLWIDMQRVGPIVPKQLPYMPNFAKVNPLPVYDEDRGQTFDWTLDSGGVIATTGKDSFYYFKADIRNMDFKEKHTSFNDYFRISLSYKQKPKKGVMTMIVVKEELDKVFKIEDYYEYKFYYPPYNAGSLYGSYESLSVGENRVKPYSYKEEVIVKQNSGPFIHGPDVEPIRGKIAVETFKYYHDGSSRLLTGSSYDFKDGKTIKSYLGKIYELMWFEGDLPEREVTAIHNYLMRKYNIK